MKTFHSIIRRLVLSLLVLANFPASLPAQEVSIPDPGLNAAIREALEKPIGPLTEQDLLGLTELNAEARNISNLQGLEAAANLTVLDLQSNRLSNLSFPNGLTNLNLLYISLNPLTNCFLPAGLTNLTTLVIEEAKLTSLTVPADMTALTVLDLYGNRFGSINLPENLTRLDFLDLSANGLTNLNLPAGLTALTQLHGWGNQLNSLSLPGDMTNLIALSLFFNQLTNLTLPAELRTLGVLELDGNRFASFSVSSNLASLGFLNLRDNLLTNLTLSAGMTRLSFLDVEGNQLRNITLPADLTQLDFLRLAGNQLTSLTLPAGLTNLSVLFLRFNQLTNLTLPPDLTRLVQIDVRGNQLGSLTLPPDMTNLSTLVLDGNPLTTFILSEPMAATNLAAVVATLRNQGVSVFTYPLTIQLVRPRELVGAFQFGITGPPGVYSVLGSTNLATWSAVGVATNLLGSVNFHDATANASPQKFYRAVLQVPPANMVFIPPNTFTMGSPTNEVDRNSDEGPQTTVILTRGFWIGQYEVNQGEYLSVMNTNPSPFPGDLSRPVTSVSWPDATNYCAKLTQREVAAGRIPPDSHYRLPTEAEWECSARAGTTTRFSYGDDPAYASLGSHAWYASNSGFTPHPVGQKLPNPWGLYDMEGNVVEWCQDWFGLLPGGVQTDPTGPPSSLSGRKVTRGGAFDNTQQSCRSAERSLFNAGPFDTDTDLGFRVALVTEPQ